MSLLGGRTAALPIPLAGRAASRTFSASNHEFVI
jgi:hypothetical protein